MINNINPRGTSFKGIAAYLMDGERGAENPDRVAWSESCDRLCGVEVKTAAKMMAYTDMSREDTGVGAKATKGAVYHFSLSWAHDESPDHAHQKETGRAAVERLGLSDHEYFMVGHKDKTHDHIHVVVNLTHSETLKRASPSYAQRRLSDFCSKYENEHGIKCEGREQNRSRHEKGEKTKHQDEKRDYSAKVTAAFEQSDNGRAFVHSLRENGLELGRASRKNSYVVVDEKGEINSLTRNLDIKEKSGAKTKAINQKLSDLQQNEIQSGDEIARRIKSSLEKSSRDDQTAEQENKILAGADAHAKKVAAQEKADERKAEQQARRHEAKFQERKSALEAKHETQRQELEKTLSETIGPKLDKIKGDAEKLQSTIEGRGFKNSLRRMWRGRQDREQLGKMRDEIGQHETAMTSARERVKSMQAEEMQKLRADHDQSRTDRSKRSADDKTKGLDAFTQKRQDHHRQRGQDRPAVHANDPAQIRAGRKKWDIQQAEKKKDQDRSTAAKTEGERFKFDQRQKDLERGKPAQRGAKSGYEHGSKDRPEPKFQADRKGPDQADFAKRQQELDKQTTPQPSKSDRIRQRAEAIRQRQADKSNDRGGFER